jgi:hypothetical protein
MATRNEQALVETADMLLTQIKQAADGNLNPSSLLQLAQAFALVAENDPNNPPARPRGVFSG